MAKQITSERVYGRIGGLLKIPEGMEPVGVKTPRTIKEARASAYLRKYHAFFSRGRPARELVDTIEHEKLHGVAGLLSKTWMDKLGHEIVASKGIVDRDLRSYLKETKGAERRAWLEEARAVKRFISKHGVDAFIALHLCSSALPSEAAEEAVETGLIQKGQFTAKGVRYLRARGPSVVNFLKRTNKERERRFGFE